MSERLDELGGLPMFATRESEIEKKERILATLAVVRKDYLERIRTEMVALYLKRSEEMGDPYVTADDARKVFESWEPPEDLSRNFLGATFKTKDWAPCGLYLSSTEGSHANRLLRWKLKGVTP